MLNGQLLAVGIAYSENVNCEAPMEGIATAKTLTPSTAGRVDVVAGAE